VAFIAEPLKLVSFHIIQRQISDILRRLAVCNVHYYESPWRLSNDTKIDDFESV